VAAVPVLALFAAAGVVAAWDALRRRSAREIASVAVALAALALAVNWPIERENLGIAWYNLANRYRDRGEYDRAIDAYQRALRGVPGYLSAYNNLARSFEDAGRRDEAVAAWRVLLALAQRQGSPQHVERAPRPPAALAAHPSTNDTPPAPGTSGSIDAGRLRARSLAHGRVDRAVGVDLGRAREGLLGLSGATESQQRAAELELRVLEIGLEGDRTLERRRGARPLA